MRDKDWFKLTAIIALGYSLIFSYLIISSINNDWMITVNFNATNEALIEIVLIPLTALISLKGYVMAEKL